MSHLWDTHRTATLIYINVNPAGACILPITTNYLPSLAKQELNERIIFTMQENRLDPLSIIESVHAEHAALCDTLEEIADSLPGAINSNQCASVIDLLSVELPLHHKDEEEGLFPLLRKRAEEEPELPNYLTQFTQEHATDECAAFDIADTLKAIVNGKMPENPEMFGYMLRSFFENYRRHLHWENTVLLPLARRKLSNHDLQELSSVMAENRFPSGSGDKSCDGNCTTCTPKKPH